MKYFLLGILILSGASAKVFFPAGTYLSENCFLVIERDLHYTSYRFAHRFAHQFEDIPYQDFSPENVLGTSVVFDNSNHTVLFGPNRCGQGISNRYRVLWRESLLELNCKNTKEKTKASFRLDFSRGQIERLTFVETKKREKNFNFKCHHFIRKEL